IYDFGLFFYPCAKTELGHLSLSKTSYTVLDLETTGLKPDKGDEIISISAVRIVNNHILDEETFQHLINPGRSIPETSIQIHGIEPELLREQPRIEEILPLFHRFAQNTVLVAHCAYFDTCFIRKREINAGLTFDNLILDTYALSKIVFPHQKDHRLEAIARRLNVPILGRHTAFGDALTTAEIFLKLIPLLMKRGVTTPEQACLACQKQSPLLKSRPKQYRANQV
ncbi:MAG TPA: 3'-5' exonuclease, partial [Desulfohalobiaceae bacterium]|nr:3'-5' exonuclease [Desulfohalobiaceae bacterium]